MPVTATEHMARDARAFERASGATHAVARIAPSPRAFPAFVAGALLLLGLLLVALALLLSPAPAHAWSNGGDYGNGFGTHDWVLYEANRLAEKRGYHWLRLGTALRATDNPDTKLHDTYHHVYDVWGAAHYGDAPDRVQALFAKAVGQLNDGRPRAASYTFGLLSHYYADICNPTHTDSSAREDDMHARHESATQTRTDEKGEHRAWIRFNGIQVRTGARAPAMRAAGSAHQYYWKLVRVYNASGWNTTTRTITKKGLNRAVNDLADLIVSVRKAAR
jgi:hypothetical protein